MFFQILNPDHIPALVKAFNKAFENYFVELQFDQDSFRKRFMERDGVSLGHSGAYFDESGKIVAFILHSIRGESLYNAGTGVLPEHWGKGLTERLYRKLIPGLIGYKKVDLEVITENKGAIKTYEKLGFKKLGIKEYPEHGLSQFEMSLEL